MNNNRQINTFFLFIDLKIILRYIYLHFIIGGVNDECRKSRIFANHGLRVYV